MIKGGRCSGKGIDALALPCNRRWKAGLFPKKDAITEGLQAGLPPKMIEPAAAAPHTAVAK